MAVTALPAQHPEVVDLGCGNRKTPGAWGVDHHPYDGVDQVVNLDVFPWAIPDNSFSSIIARHVIEHVVFIPHFMDEIHRIAKPGATVQITTPHFTSISSWTDPTHRWHLSTDWHQPFTAGYLTEQMRGFEYVETKLQFGSNFRYWVPKLMIRCFGFPKWEKNYAFIWPARDMHTTLKVVKK